MSNTSKDLEQYLQSFKIAIVGSPEVGKTSIVNQYTDAIFHRTYITTFGSNSTQIEKYSKYNLMIRDVGGQLLASVLKDSYADFVKESSGIIYVVDISREDSYDLNGRWKLIEENIIGKIPAVVAVNKCDLLDLTEEKRVEVEDSLSWARQRGYPIIFISAKTGFALDTLFITLIKRMVKNRGEKADLGIITTIKSKFETKSGIQGNLNNIKKEYDVFISSSHKDIDHAKNVYSYLLSHGYSVFFSDETLKKLGKANFRKTIDEALEHSSHLVVVGSNRENVESSWVEAEWGLFLNEIRAGRKLGNILSVITGDLKIETLPISLRGFEVVQLNPAGLKNLTSYLWK